MPAVATKTASSTRHTFMGSARVFLAESLLIPTGLLTAAYLARRLGPDGYGLFAVATALVAWVEWSLAALFSRASVKFVADADDWRPIASTIVSVHLFASVAAMLLLWAAASPLARFLGTPLLAGYLQLFAFDIPVFCLAQAHRNILVGLGGFTERAVTAAARWVSRLILVVVFVELGMSINGAILGSIGASLIELGIARNFVRPPFSLRAALRLQGLWGYAAPLLLSALALRLFDKLDLVALMALSRTPGQAGLYAAAQNLALLPGLFTASVSPLLLSSLGRALRGGESALADRLAKQGTRGALLLLPLSGIVAGAAPEIVRLVFGEPFDQAGVLLSWLTFAAVALVFVSITTAILTARGHLNLTLALTAPLPVIALIGYVVLIPETGVVAAAMVTCAVSTLSAVAGMVAVHRVCSGLPGPASVVRCGLVCLLSYAAAVSWPAPGWIVIVKLTTLTLLSTAALRLLGEFSAHELDALRGLIRRPLPG
jgi:O-antigen/teichoic acid export membrane protein